MKNDEHIVLSVTQRHWLETHGGRVEADVIRDTVSEKLYVLMGNGGGGLVRVYLPLSEE